jgi:GNAT superfamily N-acetyltransferase
MTPVYHRLQNEEHLIIRPIVPEDDAALSALRQFLHREYAPINQLNATITENPAESLYHAYAGSAASSNLGQKPPDRGYWVLVDERDQQVLGGMGFAPRQGEPGTGACELQHLYLHPQLHGRNAGAKLVQYCMQEAGKLGFRQMYLESGLPGQPNLSINKNSGLRFFRSGRTVKVAGLSTTGGPL